MKLDPSELRQLGSKIRKRRFHLDISQMKLANLCECHLNTIGKIERGETDPPYTLILKIAKALGINPKDLMPD